MKIFLCQSFTGPDAFRCSEEEHLQEAGYSNLLLSYTIPVKVITALYAAAPIENQIHPVYANCAPKVTVARSANAPQEPQRQRHRAVTNHTNFAEKRNKLCSLPPTSHAHALPSPPAACIKRSGGARTKPVPLPEGPGRCEAPLPSHTGLSPLPGAPLPAAQRVSLSSSAELRSRAHRARRRPAAAAVAWGLARFWPRFENVTLKSKPIPTRGFKLKRKIFLLLHASLNYLISPHMHATERRKTPWRDLLFVCSPRLSLTVSREDRQMFPW
ncbi:uncharacterized protein J5F26_016123 isoform 1-T2 [Ciconia maguari]